MATGNGQFAPRNFAWGDTVFSLHPDGTGAGSGAPLDSYTPSNNGFLRKTDQDLGSTAPAILPVPARSPVQHLAVQSGKDAKLRLIDLDNMSGQGGPGHVGGEVGPIISVPQGGEVLTQPAVWTNPANGRTYVFVASLNGLSALDLRFTRQGLPYLHTTWTSTTAGTSPIVANGILYVATNGLIRALNPTTGALLWSDSSIGSIHWESPILVNGILYITDESGRLTAYALPGTANP
jgi:hypothetical protein